MRNCDICGRPVILSPSASERAAKFGGTAAFYTNLFPTHAECALKKRATDTSEMMRKARARFDQLQAAGHYPLTHP